MDHRGITEDAVAAGFIGQYQHAVDELGRIILPSKFRPHFDKGGYLSPAAEVKCLQLWTPGEYDRIMEATVSAGHDPESAIITLTPEVRKFFASCSEVEIDRQGRLPIPRQLREYAGIELEVVVNGAATHIEIWNTSEWKRYSKSPVRPVAEDVEAVEEP